MPRRNISPALIPVQGGGVKKSGLPVMIGSKNRCATSKCLVLKK